MAARLDIGFVEATLAVHKPNPINAEFGVKRHRETERTAPFIEIHGSDVERHVGLHAGALVGVANHAALVVGDLVLPIVRVKPRQGKVE